MSTPSNPTLVITRRCDDDLSSSAWFLVKAVGDNDIDVAGAGNLCIGALTNDVAAGSASTAVYVPVQCGGMIKAICGGAITANTLVMADSAGEAVTATTGNYAIGIALGTFVNGEIGSFLWAPSYYEEG